MGCWVYGKREARLRFGPQFHSFVEWLSVSEQWSPSEIEAYQNEKLRELIAHAYAHVPYYRRVFQEASITPHDIKNKRDLHKIPILTKEDVRHNLGDLVSETAKRQNLIHRHTSGTSGKSLDFYHSPQAIQFQWAVWWRHRRRFGLEFGDWHANFTGKLAVPSNQVTPPYWRWSSPLRQAILTMQHMVPNKIGSIVEFLNQNEFSFYSGYPSVIHSFVLSAIERGAKLAPPPRVVVTGAENLLDFQRRDIESFTGATMTDQYGFTEGCGNASQCTEFVYHEDFEFGIMECHDPVPIGDGRVKGNIICTGFACPEFPLIRYEVGDVGVWEDSSYRCPCGRHSKVLRYIDGRIDDYVLTPEGHRVMRFDYIFKDTRSVKESQIIQDEPGSINVLLVRRPEYSEKDEQFISGEIHRWISPTLQVRFVYVNEIERERNGKFKAVKSLLARYGEGGHEGVSS